MWAPAALDNVSWNRSSQDARRVRVAFKASYALDRSRQQQIYDAVVEHLALLLTEGGWRPDGDAEEFLPQVMLRHCILGAVDSAAGMVSIRYALEGQPMDLRILFHLANRAMHSSNVQSCPIA